VVFGYKRALETLVLPGGLVLGVAALLFQAVLAKIPASVLEFYYYAAFASGLLLAWRFHSSRVFSALLLLLLAHRAVQFFAGQLPAPGLGLTALEAISFIIPLNFALLAFTRERGFTLAAAAPRLFVLFVESVFVAAICRPEPAAGAGLFHGALLDRAWFAWTPIPQISWFAFAVAIGILVTRFMTRHKVAESGLAWSLLSFFLSLNFGGVGHTASAYVATAAAILVASIIETSYAMAYHDELTGLPSRRAFNEATGRLEAPYTLAVVDIDHFKKFNDTYGHDTGDDVLCMVARNLANVTGGGQSFRVGGEEFMILFFGKPAKDVVVHLERLRGTIENSVFRLRGSDRRTAPRGYDRRKGAAQKRKTSRKTTETAYRSSTRDLSVTVSIGVAEPSKKHPGFEDVIKLADKALYRAKNAGRNRIEMATASRTRTRKGTAENIA
jgi:diguanylate cyclase (GGDEF)-like protein